MHAYESFQKASSNRNDSVYLILSKGLGARSTESKCQPAPQFLSSICKKNKNQYITKKWKENCEEKGERTCLELL